ncbi:MAG: hypothetical protein MI802_16425, partial [Desulfobacterales bacterium]|nr:hypothetical protein [Desulfobacterales bacterium]
KNNLHEFAEFAITLAAQIGFKVSSRGWAYIMEQNGYATKDQFDKVENLINRCRKEGYLPVDFTAEEAARDFQEVHEPESLSHAQFLATWLDYGYRCEDWYEPNWWEGEEYYIQMIVEKIDLVTLFQPVCKQYHVPIANAKGWSSIRQRAEYARRFKEAEDKGLECVLLYCGDHDPDGLRISETLRKNIDDVKNIYWEDGEKGYDPSSLTIERFGLNYDFITRNNLTWIDNLVTGGGELAKMIGGQVVQGTTKNGRPHPNFHLPYLQEYIAKIGVRKCEANALVIAPEAGRALCERTIVDYLGEDCLDRFRNKKETEKQKVLETKAKFKVDERIEAIIRDLRGR